jgi:D-arabinose 1-dehydrogenase-like Zn-dependent alcohol dehydrogenase
MMLVLENSPGPASARRALVPDGPVPEPAPEQVVVQMEWGGLNRIDTMLHDGQVPRPPGRHVLGAQGAGRIAALGEGVGLTLGQLVALYPYGGCGHCDRCDAGNETLCHRARLDGVNAPGMFRSHYLARAADAFPAPTGLGSRAAALGSAMAVAWHVLVCRGGLRRGETVAIVSITSGLGACCGALADLLGAEVVGVARQRSLARVGPLPGWLARTWASDAPSEHEAPPRADLVVDAVGAPTLPLMHRLVRTSGRIVTVGAHAGGNCALDLWRLFTREQDLRGSHGCHRADMLEALRALTELDVSTIVDSIFPVFDHASAYKRLEAPGRFGNVLLHLLDQSIV